MKELAEAFLKEAEKDLKRAEKAFKEKDYPEVAFHSQQCIEKCVKAILELKNASIRNHGINLTFVLRQVYFSEWNEDLEFLAEALEKSWEFYTRARYPSRILGKIKLPEELIDEEIARDLFETAQRALEIAKRVFQR